MGTKNRPGKFDCYANAEPDEPMFILLGRDRHAPALVWLWAVLREISGEDAAKVVEAKECAVNMEAWLLSHGKQGVDLPDVVSVGATEIARLIRQAKIAGLERMANESAS